MAGPVSLPTITYLNAAVTDLRAADLRNSQVILNAYQDPNDPNLLTILQIPWNNATPSGVIIQVSGYRANYRTQVDFYGTSGFVKSYVLEKSETLEVVYRSGSIPTTRNFQSGTWDNGTLQYPPQTLLGNAMLSATSYYQPITLGNGLTMTGNVLSVGM